MSQPDTKARLTHELGQAILDAYHHGLFGKVSRPEIDALCFAASVQILFADRQELWLELEDGRRFNWLRLGIKEFIQIDARLKLSTARINTLIENASALSHGAEPSVQELLAELRLLLAQTKQSSAELDRGLIRLHVVNRTTRKALEAFFIGQGGLVDTSFNRDIIVLRLADLVEMLVAHVPDQHGFTLQLLDAALEQLPTDQQQTVANVRDTTPDSVLREHLTKLALETTVRSGAGWTVSHLLGWLSQHIPPIL
jgi:hypothetical protein